MPDLFYSAIDPVDDFEALVCPESYTPLPSPSEAMATTENPGLRIRPRSANLRSCISVSTNVLELVHESAVLHTWGSFVPRLSC